MAIIETDFREGIAGTAVSTSANWFLGEGSLDSGRFQSSGGGIVVGTVGTGEVRYTHSSRPNAIHQGAEAGFVYATGAMTGSVYAGVTCRQGSSGYLVVARVKHNAGARALELGEVYSGTFTLLASLAIADSAAIGSVRLEVIGQRARAWYDPGAPVVTDRPPDLAATVKLREADAKDWGIYLKGGGNHKLTRFAAKDMPSACLPAPHVRVSDASGQSLVPITLSVSSPSTARIEWEVVPADADDFAEAYRDEAAASLSTRVFFVRPGFAYDCRVRGLGAAGDAEEPWGPYARITAAGSKDAAASIPMPTVDFPDVTPDYVMERAQDAIISATLSDTGRERTVQPWVRPRHAFKLKFETRDDATAQTLIDFYEQQQGKDEAFRWTHPLTGEHFALRFDKEDYEAEGKDRGDDTVWWDIAFDVVEVVTNGTSVLVLDLHASLTAYNPTQVSLHHYHNPCHDDPRWKLGEIFCYAHASGIPSPMTLPTTYKYCKLWLDADNDYSTDAERMDSWAEIATGQTVVNTGGLARPVMREKGMGMVNAVQFRADRSQYFTIPTLNLVRPFQLIICCDSGSGRAFSSDSTATDFLLGPAGTLGMCGAKAGSYAGGTAFVMGAHSWHFHEMRAFTDRTEYFLDGNFVAVTSAVDTPAPGDFAIGRGFGGNYFTGFIAEVVAWCFPDNATMIDLGNGVNPFLKQYFQKKYGI